MGNDLAKMILDILKDYDYRNVSKKQLYKIMEGPCYGGMCPESKKIYICNKMSYEDTTTTQLHEFAHAYLHTINKFDTPEEEVDKLAYDWKRQIDGVFIK